MVGSFVVAIITKLVSRVFTSSQHFVLLHSELRLLTDDAAVVSRPADTTGDSTPTSAVGVVSVLSQASLEAALGPACAVLPKVPKQLSFADEEVGLKKPFRSWASECSDTSDYMDLSDLKL